MYIFFRIIIFLDVLNGRYQSKKMKILHIYFVFSNWNPARYDTTTCRVYSSTLVLLRHAWLQISARYLLNIDYFF